MSLFAELPGARIAQCYLEGADRLHKTITSHSRTRMTWKRGLWADQLRLAVEKDDVPQNTLLRVLDWYCKNVEKVKLNVTSAAAFRKLFPILLDMMGKQKLSEDDIPTELRATYLDCMEIFDTFIWPEHHHSGDQFIATTLINYNTFFCKLRNYLVGAKSPIPDVVSHVWEHLPTPIVFMEQWIAKIHGVVVNWVAWSGDLSLHAFSVERHLEKIIVTHDYAWGRGVAVIANQIRELIS